MIAADQPTVFGSAVKAAISSRHDGNMKFGLATDEVVQKNRRDFLAAAGIDIAHTTLVPLTYDTDDFARYRVVGADEQGAGMVKRDVAVPADALVVTRPGHALFLPLADCVGMIIYDPEHRVLMVSHVGRHSAEIEGARRSVAYLAKHFNTAPAKLQVWLSPGVGKVSYPLHKFNGRGLAEVIVDQLQAAGVGVNNIEQSLIDTATSEHYYSHSEYLKGNDEPGRFAIAAMMMAAQGEPAY